MKPRIAFYSPIKPPDHSIPSGDREIARLMVRALELAGYDVGIASRYIAYQKRPSSERFEELKQSALDELRRLKADWHGLSEDKRPKLWFTYHPYCKAPDWLGPAMAEEFGIPYVTAEAARTRQATDADWKEARAQVRFAVDKAAINFCLKQSDLAYLKSFMSKQSSINTLTPFVDLEKLKGLDVAEPDWTFPAKAPLLVAAGMMRPGTKTRSYLALAEALELISQTSWNLVIIGDGPSKSEIEAAFGWADSGRIHWTGAIPRSEVLAWFRRGDIFTWPGIREAIGVVFMEAQSQGLPVVAFNSLGVPLVVKHEESGLLVPEGDTQGYADAVLRLLNITDLRKTISNSARNLIAEEHDIGSAVQTFKRTLGPLVSGH